MKKINFLTFILGCLCSIATVSAQTVSLTFTGRDATNRYVQLNKVVVTNLTKSWQETIYWPDTVLTLTNKTGISDVQEQGIGLFSYPNPFNGTSSVLLTIPQSEEVYMAVYNITGQRVMEFSSQLEAGINHFDIGFQKPQVYFLVVNTLEGRMVQKLVNVGHSGDNYIKFRSTLPLSEEQTSKIQKRQSSQPFSYGDMMEYVGYATINGNMEESQRITQAQGNTQTFSLKFNATQPTTLPKLSTITASNITETSVVSGGNITSDGGSQVTARGVCWGTSHNPTINGNHTTDGSGIGNFTSNITNLTGNTTYYVRAYATNSVGTAFGNEIVFVTAIPATLPTINTFTASNITDSSATSGGNITSDGGAQVTARGVCWSTSQNPTINDNHTTNGSGTGSFTSNLTGLTKNTTYYVRAYATNAAGTAYGNQVSFTANTTIPILTTIDVSNVTENSAICGGKISSDGGTMVTARGVCWSTSQYPTINDNHTIDGSGIGSFTSHLVGLELGKIYYVRAYAINAFDTAYGNQISFIAVLDKSFSVGNGKYVYFSPGNLQWSPTNGGDTLTTHTIADNLTAAGTWRFAPNQWDTIGADNMNIYSTYTGWIDLFGWGTSGYNNKYPYMAIPIDTLYGNGSSSISNTNYDWGVYNAIYNSKTQTTNAPGTWRTLKGWVDEYGDEWGYLLSTRNTLSGIRYAKAVVNGVNGLIIVPDNWSNSIYALDSTNIKSATFISNVINALDWVKLDSAGCVFLPAAGRRNSWDSVIYIGSSGVYWSARNVTETGASYIGFSNQSVGWGSRWRRYGLSVRLVHDINKPIRNLPVVNTIIASNITGSSAVCGGYITSDGGAMVTTRGICWSTSPNPTINDYHTSNGSDTGNFVGYLTNLYGYTKYYVRAYATNAGGTAYGNQVEFITLPTPNLLFSVTDTQKVLFSSGNLQWSVTNGGNTATTHAVVGNGTATGTWRFAPNQWDTIGVNNRRLIDTSYTGWIDLFYWGSSGYNNNNPNGGTISNYGNGSNDISGTNYDWGVYNAIYNSKTNHTDAPGTWRTLTKDEWNYLLNTRTTSSGIRYAKAVVNGVRGLIIVPDTCYLSSNKFSMPNTLNAPYSSNTIKGLDWLYMERSGCVFLPAAGDRSGTSTFHVNYTGFYWSANMSIINNKYAYELKFDSISVNPLYSYYTDLGLSVRLVQDVSNLVQNLPVINTIVASNITDSSAVSGGNIISDGGSMVTTRGICWSTSPNPTINDNHTNNGLDTGSFTSNLTGLTSNTTYYVRAYATNAAGITYGNQVTFTTKANITIPILTTIVVSNITDSSAVSGGIITSNGGAVVIARGICWDTLPNPTINSNHTSDSSGIGSFTSNITRLKSGTTYYVRAYATNAAGTAYGNQDTFTTPATQSNAQFSVSATQKVLFSPGNLQWSAKNGGTTATTHVVAGNGTAAGTWRFAPQQWDTIGTNNSNIDSSYSGWIDLFGWGTSGYNNKYPYTTSTNYSDYGNGSINISGTNYDWGVYNAIYNPKTNTTDAPGTWRTLTQNEWAYLLNTRSTISGIRYAKATINGVEGLIIVPDDWSTSIYLLNNPNTQNALHTSNIINVNDWAKMDAAGCVFLPSAGNRKRVSINAAGPGGYYWSSTCYNSDYAYYLTFGSYDLNPSITLNRYFGLSIRLVRNVNQ